MSLNDEILVKELGSLMLQNIDSLSVKQLTKACKTEYQRLINEILGAICNEALSDFQCVEEIVSCFEHYGYDCGFRHDFG